MTFSDEVIQLHQEQHGLISKNVFNNAFQYAQHLMHVYAYQYIAALCTGKSVLDIGCNTGYGTELLAVNAAKVVGVDVSKSAIDTARNICENPEIKFVVIDGKRLPFKNGSFGAVVGCQVIEHIADIKSFMDEVTRVLLPDGLALFTTPNAVIRIAPGTKPWNKFHVKEYNEHELRELFTEIFESVEISGLLASHEIDELLKKRYAQAMANAVRESNPSKVRKSLRFMKKLLPDTVSDFLYAKINTGSENGGINNFKERFCVNDFYYAQSELNNALDFLVVAQGKRGNNTR